MLAFNLGIFFRNLQGADVLFSAKNEKCEVKFVGGVSELREQADLNRHLSVLLTKGALACRISFEEDEDQENHDTTEVDVRVSQQVEGHEVPLLQTRFVFEEITLKPFTGEDLTAEEEEPGPEIA